MSIISRIFGGAQGPTKLNAVSVNQSCQGLPLPVVLGKHKIQQSLLWLNGFNVHEVSGGKGGGKGAGFEYSADTVIALCEGPITAVDDVWYNQTWLSNVTGAENTTVPATGIYTTAGAQTATADNGVSGITSGSITTNDVGAPTSTVISDATYAPLTKVDYGTALSQGQYSINTAPVSGSPFVLTSVDNHSGSTTKYYGAIGSPGASNGLVGYTFIIAGFTNTVNNSGVASPTQGFICTASDTGSITLSNAFGVAETHAATATEPGNTYHFSAYDSANATPIQIAYSYKLNFVRAQEITEVPPGETIYVGAPYANGVDEGVMYYDSGLPNFGVLLTPVATNPPTVTGTYHFISSGSGQLGSTYIFAAGDINAEVLVTYQYQNNSLIPKDAPSTLNFTVFNGAQGQSVWSLLSSTFPGEALAYTSTAYVGYNPMELAGSADIPNVTYEVQTADGYGGGIPDCNPIQCVLRVLTDPVWGLGSGVTTFPAQAIDIGPGGTWGSSATDAGFVTQGSPSSASGSGWTNPSGIEAGAASPASKVGGGAQGPLIGTNFGLSFAPTTLGGVQVQFSIAITPVTVLALTLGAVKVEYVQLMYSGSPLGPKKYVNDTFTVTSPGKQFKSYTIGSNVDTWGAPLTQAIVNSSSFGFQVVFSGIGGTLEVNDYLMSVYGVSASFTVSTPKPANTITTGPVTVKVYSSSGAGWQGFGGSLLSTTTVNTPVFNQVIKDYPIFGFSDPANNANGGGGYKLNPMVAVETTANSALLDTKTLTGTNSTFEMGMTGTFTVPVAGTYTFFVNYANYSSWAFYVQGATLLSGTTPPSSTTVSQGDGHPAFPSTGPTTSYPKMGEQSKDDGSHPIVSTMRVSFPTSGTFNWEAVYTQTSAISRGGEANGYFQITTMNGVGQVGASGGAGTVGSVILPTVPPGGNASNLPTAPTAWNWFAANGYFISANLDKQDSASSVIGKWLEAGMCAGFMSEGLFKLVPFGDTSTMGNGCIWLAPAAYIVALDDSCFLAKDGEEPVKISRSAWQDGYNYCQVKWANRVAQYADEVTPEFDQAAIDRFGLRMEEAQDYNFICNLTSATFAANMRVKRSVNIRNTYSFKLPFTYSYLEPMDLVTISTTSLWAQALTADAQLNVVSLPVRIIKTVDDPVEGISITAEDYPYGVGQPVLYNKDINTATPAVDLYAQPGDTEVVLFEATQAMTGNSSTYQQIWIGASGASNEWGGCQIWVSSDGASYLQIGEITSRARIGELAADFPNSAVDPDENNELIINMAANCPALDAGTTADADQGNTACFVDGEIISYSSCTLTGQSQFTMNLGAPSVAGYIHRGQKNTTNAYHNAGTLFLRLDSAVFKYSYDPAFADHTIYFKFLSFNRFSNSTQNLSEVTAIQFAVPGLHPGTVDASSGLPIYSGPTRAHRTNINLARRIVFGQPVHGGGGSIGWGGS